MGTLIDSENEKCQLFQGGRNFLRGTGKLAEEGFGGILHFPPSINMIVFRFDIPPACGGELHSKKLINWLRLVKWWAI
jgi:hypothetical protein